MINKFMKIGQAIKAYVNRGKELIECFKCNGKQYVFVRSNNGKAMWRCDVCNGRGMITRNQDKAKQRED